MNEHELSHEVHELLKRLRTAGIVRRFYRPPHAKDVSHRAGKGFPDWVVVLNEMISTAKFRWKDGFKIDIVPIDTHRRVVYIELKADKGKLDPEQKAWLDDVGGFVCRSLPEVLGALGSEAIKAALGKSPKPLTRARRGV